MKFFYFFIHFLNIFEITPKMNAKEYTSLRRLESFLNSFCISTVLIIKRYYQSYMEGKITLFKEYVKNKHFGDYKPLFSIFLNDFWVCLINICTLESRYRIVSCFSFYLLAYIFWVINYLSNEAILVGLHPFPCTNKTKPGCPLTWTFFLPFVLSLFYC